MTLQARGAPRLPGWLAVLVGAVLLASAAPAAGQGDLQRIAAVVNDDIISIYDLDARVQIALTSTGAPNNPEIRKRYQQQILKAMIDERLQKQEAAKQNIKVSDQELKRAVADVEKANNMPPGGLEAFAARLNLPRSTVIQQIEVATSWRKLIARKIMPRVEIGDEEVDEVLQRMEANRGLPEMHVAEIFMAVDSPDQEDEVLRNLERLVEQMQQGARFGALARQFSQSATAAAGGDLGWVQQGQLDEQIETVLKQMPPGTISKPIRTVGGYHLMALVERRRTGAAEPRFELQQGLVPVAPRTPISELEGIKERLAAAVRDAKDCPAFDAAVKQMGRARSVNLGKLAMKELPGPLQAVIEPLKAGQTTPPLQADAGTLMVLMVCAREEIDAAPLPGRDEIQARLREQRADLMARRYLRDLRRAAFVDLRV